MVAELSPWIPRIARVARAAAAHVAGDDLQSTITAVVSQEVEMPREVRLREPEELRGLGLVPSGLATVHPTEEKSLFEPWERSSRNAPRATSAVRSRASIRLRDSPCHP
jgi:hypothetical protein